MGQFEKAMRAGGIRHPTCNYGRMSIERIFHCDWRDCAGHVRTVRRRPSSSFITVTESAGPPLHFCTWDCLLKFAGEKPPVEIILWSAEAS